MQSATASPISMDLGRLGIAYTTYAGQYRRRLPDRTTTCRRALTRNSRDGEARAPPNAYAETYADDAMWDNYASPIAKAAGVSL